MPKATTHHHIESRIFAESSRSSYEEALADVKSAIRFHIETFGAEVVPDDSPLLEAFVAEATIPA